MDDTLTKIIDLIPPKFRATVLVLVLLSPYIGRAYHAVRTGGGIRGIAASIWLGTNTPKASEEKKDL